MSAATTLVPEAHAQTAAGADTESLVSYRFNDYDEDAYAPRPVIGSPERYGVISQQFQLTTPVGSNSAINATATHEVMSGSSPWYVLPGPGNRPIQVMSGATIRDHRNAVSASWTQGTGSSGGTTYSASYSAERDYHATAVGIERSIPLSAALTLGIGGSFSHDLIDPTDAQLYDRVQHAQKNTTSLFGSLAWIIADRWPERIASLTMLSRPHPASFARALKIDLEQSLRRGARAWS